LGVCFAGLGRIPGISGWRLLLTPDNPTPRDGLRFAIDNGAFAKDGFQPEPFRDLVERLGCAADFVVLPDIVAGGADSLSLSVSWIPKLRGIQDTAARQPSLLTTGYALVE
jgi:hypothetical protein